MLCNGGLDMSQQVSIFKVVKHADGTFTLNHDTPYSTEAEARAAYRPRIPRMR